jgi:predicted HicB family RNase H-like nuclease
MMEYKGYIGHVEFDDKSNIFHGEVINLRDVVTFQGSTVTQLRKAFRDSVDDYLEFCAERGESPERPYSGRFMVRLEPDLHKAVAMNAKLAHKSLNEWVCDTLAVATQ